MDDFFFALLLVALATPLIAFAALVVAIRQARAIRRLETRLRGLELLRAQEPPTRAVAAPAPRPPAAAAPPAAPLIATPEPTPAPAIETPAGTAPQSIAPPPPLPSSVPPVPQIATAPRGSPRAAGFEERFGTRWVVWVGGIALALGGIFLVRYTIQQG